MIEEIKGSLFIMMLIFMGALSGGIAAKFISHFLKKDYLYLQVFCGGILAGLLGFDVIPETLENYRPLGIYAGLSIGALFMIIMDRYVHHGKHASFERPNMYMILFIALLFHSIPTGVALGMSFQNEQFQQPSLFTAILVHHIPEGVVLMISVLVSNVKARIFWILCLLLSFSVGITTYSGMTIQTDSVKVQTLFLGAAIGTLSYVAFYEILWKGFRAKSNFKMVSVAILGTLSFFLLLQIAA